MRKKENIAIAIYANTIIHPCHADGYYPQPYVFALNQSFFMGAEE